MTTVYAIVDESGKMSSKSGISSVSKPSTGTYLVNYATAFTQSPGVSATPWGSGTLCALNIFAENMCEVFVTDLKGTAVDGGFSFLAVGD